MIEDKVRDHYSNKYVQEEIAKYCRSRWVGIHCTKKDSAGRPILVRYTRRGRSPLTISEPRDVTGILDIFAALGPRAVYGTANVYKSLTHHVDVSDMSNVVSCMPTWDIDSTIEQWENTIAVARLIVDFLHDGGVRKSVFTKWSGNGCHVHIHHGALSPEITAKAHPLDLSYAAVRYTILHLSDEFRKLAGKSKLPKVENNMDPQRLFTASLSLHRTLDLVCVCIKPEDLDKFSPDWLRIEAFKHYDNWDGYAKGEADNFCLSAYETVGPR